MLSSDPRFISSQSEAKHLLAELHAGITLASGAVAESGAIIARASAEEPRSISLLPLHHIALVTEETIFATLTDAAGTIRDLAGEGGSSAVTLIGGPSKTADIEKVLVTGMHGPKRFTVLIIRQTSTGADNRTTPLSHNTEGTAP